VCKTVALPGTVALNPSILGEDETVELLSEVLNHVIAFGLSVYKEVQTNLLLEADDSFDLFLDEVFVLSLGDLAFAQLCTSLTNFCGLLQTIIYELLVLKKHLINLQGTIRWWWWGT